MKPKSTEIQNQQQKPEWEDILEKYGLFAYHEYIITGKIKEDLNEYH